MDILTKIMENADAFPDRPAVISDNGSITWRGLYDGSRRLAERISAACSGTLWTLSHDTVNDYSKLMHSLGRSGACVWVSTPSFADVCLADPAFSSKLAPQLSLFIFCGETLSPNTARRLYERFPGATVVNTYGPTESTVAVTDVVITREMCVGADALPVGRAKPGTVVFIEAAGGAGEIIIAGNTVAKGYFHMPEKTAASFFETEINGKRMRAYRTGDLGYLDSDGMLHYCGRIDSQIKLHGYRIEIEDVENNLTALDSISKAAVIPVEKDGRVKSLTACVTLENSELTAAASGVRPDVRKIKDGLCKRLPDYMIPKKIVFLDEIPLTSNGKADRKALKSMLSSESAARPASGASKRAEKASGKTKNGDIN